MFRTILTIGMPFALFLLFTAPQVNAGDMDYALYQKFLDNFVRKDQTINGFKLAAVDYKAIHTGSKDIDSLYLQTLEMFKKATLSSLKTREERLAFWINAYNIGAIKMIVDHYPVDSIRSRKISWIKNPWRKKIITVEGKGYSLGEIEHEIILKKLKEPMAHFAIVCASLSCPDLSEKVYRPGSVKGQIKSMARAFLANRKKGLRIDRGRGEVYFSQIFKFDKNTFPAGARDAIPLIVPNMGKEDGEYLKSGRYSIKYFSYDWSANDLGRTKQQ